MGISTNRNIRVTVTKNDIRLGIKGDSEKCPIARACKRLGLKGLSVGGTTVRHTGAAVQYGELQDRSRSLPLKAQAFVDRFDDGLEVQPFSFTLK